MPPNRSFVTLIISNGRPNDVKTVATLDRQGYTGEWKIVVDDEDTTAPAYVERYGADRVVMFSKEEVASRTDTGDNLPGRMAAVYARNACFDIARDLGYDYFLELDDDYLDFQFREDRDSVLKYYSCRNLDDVFSTMLGFLDASKSASVALAQGGDYIGGAGNANARGRALRKAMNSWFFRTDCDVRFSGRMNDDVSTYVVHSHRGRLFFTLTFCMLMQVATQAGAGGLSEEYIQRGTYVKSFYSVMMCPSAVGISMLFGARYARVHHHVRWRNVAPKILSQRYQHGVRE